MRMTFVFLPFATGIIILMTGVIVMIYQPKNKLAAIFLLLCVSVFVWTLGYSINYATDSSNVALWACRAAFLGVVFIPSTTLHFVLSVLKPHRYWTQFIWISYAISCAFLPFLPTEFFLAKTQRMFWGFYPLAGPAYKFFVFYYGVVFLICVSTLLYFYKLHKTKQAKYILVAFFVAAWSLVDYLPNYGIVLYPSAYMCALLWILIIGYAICRHRLFDVEAIVDIVYRDRLMMLGLMSASVNHEIKNPLYIMKGQIDLLKNDRGANLNSELGRYIDKMEQQIVRIQKLLKMYTGMSRPDQVCEKTAELQVSVQNVADFLEFEFKQREIQLKLDIRPDIPWLRCNPVELESVFMNLLLNACQAIERKGSVEITAINIKKMVLITVKDNGPGMTVAQKKYLFEPLISNKSEGSGLGLFITKSIIEKHEGRICVTSQPGQGTAFEIELPAALSEKTE